jgi:hypothetical protein
MRVDPDSERVCHERRAVRLVGKENERLTREKIRQLALRYALAVDGKDLDGVTALFV